MRTVVVTALMTLLVVGAILGFTREHVTAASTFCLVAAEAAAERGEDGGAAFTACMQGEAH